MSVPKQILIRADGNPEIATGHLMRTLSIARSLSRKGALVHFVVSDETSRDLLCSFWLPEEHYPIHVLHTDYRDPESELGALEHLLLQESFHALLIDSYFVTPKYLETLQDLASETDAGQTRRFQLAYLDDLYAFDYPVDLVINYDLAPPEDFYTCAGRKLLGGRYTPLREQFAHLKKRGYAQTAADIPHGSSLCPADEIHLLVSAGGTDPFHVARQLLTALSPSEWHYHILAGPMHPDREFLEEKAAQDPRIHLYRHVSDMASLMQQCTLAVSAAGTTLYELCAAGLPAVSYTFADNQLATARDMQTYAGIPYAGDMRDTAALPSAAANASEIQIDSLQPSSPNTSAHPCIKRMVQELKNLAQNPSAQQELSARMQSTIDGHGAEYIANELLKMI